MKQERAVLAGGSFWGMQNLIRELPSGERPRSVLSLCNLLCG